MMVSERVQCESDAWTFALKRLDDYWNRVLASGVNCPVSSIAWTIDAMSDSIDAKVSEMVGEMIADANLLGRRTRELHEALGAEVGSAFQAEPLKAEDFDQLVKDIQAEVATTATLLRGVELPGVDQASLANMLEQQANELLTSWQADGNSFSSTMIRVHGDYHLGQVLRMSDDFMIIDFEGEPDRSLSERRGKRPPMKDVAGMIRSLHYASNAASVGLLKSLAGVESSALIENWQTVWFQASAHSFMRGYFGEVGGNDANWKEQQRLLDLFLLEKSLYELRYELNNRPTWARIPLRGLTELLEIDA
jgi:trehalose synthase-fused probable maltokinase